MSVLKKYSFKLLDTVGALLKWGCASYCLFEYVGEFIVCVGPSMEPTLYNYDVVIVEHMTPRFRAIEKGDIVIAKSPSNPRQHICKRVRGLSGDRIRHGSITSTVPAGHMWLEGDNSGNSDDSRTYGPVPQGLTYGRVLYKAWSFTDNKHSIANYNHHE